MRSHLPLLRHHPRPDGLRQEHLERLGWTFHRIWSQDWFYHHENETARAIAAYQVALTAADNRERPLTLKGAVPTGGQAAPVPAESRPAVQQRGPCPIHTHRGAGAAPL
jgi:REase_MTES_1575